MLFPSNIIVQQWLISLSAFRSSTQFRGILLADLGKNGEWHHSEYFICVNVLM